MDDKNGGPGPVSYIVRRLRYQGPTQWVTLILGLACIVLFITTTPIGLVGNLKASPKVISFSSDSSADNEVNIGLGSGNADGDTGKTTEDPFKEDPADIIEESIPEFTGSQFWEGVDWDDPLELPDKIAGAVFEMTVETGEEDVEIKTANGDLTVVTIYYRESIPKGKPKGDVLLLHSSRFTSETWVTVDTTKTFAAMGYRAVALDLPGFGKSAGSVLFGERAALLLDGFIETHEMKKPIIVAPSMAGGYALPFVMSRPHKVTALIALAPTSTERFKPDQYHQLQIPVLSIYGTRDSTYGSQVTKRLSAIPNIETKLIQDAHHAAYLDQPDEWHRICYIFFRRIEAWVVRTVKSGATTTEHPVIVTASVTETEPPEEVMDIKLPPRKNPDGTLMTVPSRQDGESWLDLMMKQNPEAAKQWMASNKITPPPKPESPLVLDDEETTLPPKGATLTGPQTGPNQPKGVLPTPNLNGPASNPGMAVPQNVPQGSAVVMPPTSGQSPAMPGVLPPGFNAPVANTATIQQTPNNANPPPLPVIPNEVRTPNMPAGAPLTSPTGNGVVGGTQPVQTPLQPVLNQPPLPVQPQTPTQLQPQQRTQLQPQLTQGTKTQTKDV